VLKSRKNCSLRSKAMIRLASSLAWWSLTQSALTNSASDELIKRIQAYQDGCNRSQVLSDECERLKLEILSYMGEAEKLTHAGKTLATWKCAKSGQRIDTKSLASAHPDIAKAFTFDTLGSRRFLLKGAV
jgi:hypothetical protein